MDVCMQMYKYAHSSSFMEVIKNQKLRINKLELLPTMHNVFKLFSYTSPSPECNSKLN